jgi:Na+/proline symporter
MWAGRGGIATGALLALWLVYVGQKNEDFAPLKMIVEMQFVAMGFSCQVLPLVIDMLFIRRGTRAGAVCGMTVGLIVVMMFTPLPRVLLGHGTGASIANTAGYLKTLFDIGFCGFVANASVFVLVSMFTKKPNPERVAEFEEIMLKKEISD